MASVEELRAENERLKREVEEYRQRLQGKNQTVAPAEKWDSNQVLSIIVFGASGDLAKKKTYPCLFKLFAHGLIPANSIIYGYARSPIEDKEFKTRISANFKGHDGKKEAFLERCFYYAGAYDSAKSMTGFQEKLAKLEAETSPSKTLVANRIFYLAIPPDIFVGSANAIHAAGRSSTGWTRLIIEKPFGRDLVSSTQLSDELAKIFSENDLYRIDHYLGKELVQNLMALRFGNQVFEPLWNRHFIHNVQISFKEDIGCEGRGGYFDKFGMIRDVMQNHMIQILALFGMEPPVSSAADHIQDEKVKLLRSVTPLSFEEVVIGQYTASADGKKPGYLDDKTVPQDSIAETFATVILRINNSRWSEVPFILKAGKGLNERKTEVRVQFREPPGNLFEGLPRNELVMRVSPSEAVYLKLNSKRPGFTSETAQIELDLTYKDRFEGDDVPDAYERLIYDVVRGDHSLFVRDDELDAAWKIFTPLLHHLEKNKVKPEPYQFGSRGPASSDKLIESTGFKRGEGYVWRPKK